MGSSPFLWTGDALTLGRWTLSTGMCWPSPGPEHRRTTDDLNGDHLQPGEQTQEVTAQGKEVCKSERKFLAMRLFGRFNKLPREALFLWITLRRDQEKCF